MSGNPRASGRRRSPVVEEMVRFLGTTALGLAVDLGVFALAVALGVPPGVANAISSAAAVGVLYVLSTRVTFRVRPSFQGFAVFVGWYALSITVFSFLVQFLHDTWELAPMIAKLVTLPVSFLVNFVAVRTVLVTVFGARGHSDDPRSGG